MFINSSGFSGTIAVLYLIFTTLVWGFSYSLTGEFLSGHVDSWFSAMFRLLLAALMFLPFLRWRGYRISTLLLYMLAGALQLGVSYVLGFQAYMYLSVADFLLFTVVTPLYITLIYDLMCGRGVRLNYVCSALLAMLGAAIINYNKAGDYFWHGFLLVQLGEFFLALGMVGYKRLQEVCPMEQHMAFSWFYLGAALVATISWVIWGKADQAPSNASQWGVLLWLGMVATGLGYFMWNYGATRVDCGTLCIMNSMHVPVGLLVNLAIWQQRPEWISFSLGSALIFFSLWVHERWIVNRVESPQT